MRSIREVGSIMPVDLEKFKTFCVMNNVKGIDAIENTEELLKSEKTWSAAMKVYTFDGKTLVLLNFATTKKKMEKVLLGSGLPYLLCGDSFMDEHGYMAVVDISK